MLGGLVAFGINPPMTEVAHVEIRPADRANAEMICLGFGDAIRIEAEKWSVPLGRLRPVFDFRQQRRFDPNSPMRDLLGAGQTFADQRLEPPTTGRFARG